MKNPKTILLVVWSLVVLLAAFSAGVLVGWAMPGNPGFVLPVNVFSWQIVTQTTPAQERDRLFTPFWEAWDIVKTQYVQQPVDEVEMMRGAIRGMLASLGDEHTSYMDPDQYRQQNAPLQGEYEGIGAWVDITGEYLKIIAPMPGSPAEAAGLQPDDLVIAVDGEDMTGVDGNLVLRRILGPAGTEVTLTIRRASVAEPFDVTIKRAKITIPSVKGEMLEDEVAYVQLLTFGDDTAEELNKTLKELLSKNPKGLILDLRNNGGGYLKTAVKVVSEFIPADKVVLIEEYGDGTRQTYETEKYGIARDIPLVVLVNEGTASASEITAGAIQDYGRGKLVGTNTYGKGSVQNWVPLANDQGAVRVTIARWLTPKGRQINKVGLEPDIVVEFTEEDIQIRRDVQLEKAVELLKN